MSEREVGPDRLLLRPLEVAAVLGISRSHVYDELASGRLKSVYIQGARRVRRTDLTEYVESLPDFRRDR